MRRSSLLLIAMLPLLAGCQTLGLSDESAATDPATAQIPSCPATAVLFGADMVTKLKAATPAGAAQNPANVVFMAQMSQARLDCNFDREANTLSVDVHFAIRAAQGPAAMGEPPPLDYFVAVIDADGNLLSKKTFRSPPEMAGKATNTFQQNVGNFPVPLGKDKRPPDYEVVTGFQLTPDELAYNRTPRPLPIPRAQAGR